MKTTFDLHAIGAGKEQIEHLANGGVVFLKGDKGDRGYIVKTGRVEIREGGRVLETIETSEFFGEMALIDLEPRSASAVAIAGTELIVVDRETFHMLVRDVPDFAITMMRLMARRLRAMNANGRAVEELLPLVQSLTGKSA